MSKIITAIYEAETTVTNAFDDLISAGIPQEKIRTDKDKRQVQVASPDTSQAEITEILRRHQPTKLH